MLLVIFSLIVACGSSSEDSGNNEDTGGEGIDCSADFRSSALITVLDQEGTPLSGVNLAYTVNNVEGEYMDSLPNGVYYVGGEEAGDFVVQLSIDIPLENDPCCWDVGEAILEFTVEEDECHVITQELETTLEWSLLCVDVDENGECG